MKLRKSAHIVNQNDDLLEEVNDIGDNLLDVEDRLDEVLPNHVSLTGVKPGEYEIIVVSRFENVNAAIADEGPLIVYKGQVRSIEDVRKGHIADLTLMRQTRLGRPLRRSEIPRVTEIFRVGTNGYIPNAKKTWAPFKRTHRRNMRFGRKKHSMFSLRNEWSIQDLRTSLEAKDQADRF